MSCETISRQKETQAAVADQVSSDKGLLEQVIENVRRDSRQDTDQYLDETAVPHGGE